MRSCSNPSAGRAPVHDPARQSGAAGRSLPHRRRRRFPQPRRRRRRPGRAAGAGVPRARVPRARGTASCSISAASPTSPTCRRIGRCAASTPGRATRCSTPGASGTGRAHSTRRRMGGDRPGRSRRCSTRSPPTRTSRCRRRRAPAAIISTCAGWRRGCSRATRPPTCRRRLLALTAATIADAIAAQRRARPRCSCAAAARTTARCWRARLAVLGAARVATHRRRTACRRARRGARVRVARARIACRREPGNLPAVTGARRPARAGRALPGLAADGTAERKRRRAGAPSMCGWTRRFQARERRAAAAGGGGVRVLDHELRALEVFLCSRSRRRPGTGSSSGRSAA